MTFRAFVSDAALVRADRATLAATEALVAACPGALTWRDDIRPGIVVAGIPLDVAIALVDALPPERTP